MKNGEITGVQYDNLIGGAKIPTFIANVSIGSGEIRRGELLSKKNGVYSAVTGSDFDNPLAIASENVGSSENREMSVYLKGEYNRSSIIVGSSVDLDDYEDNLRRDGIYLTDVIYTDGGTQND